MSLTARYLEAAGLPTVIIGSALDIVTHCGVPRYLHTDFPLGNPCGKPYNTDMQQEIARLALALATETNASNILRRAPFIWSQSNAWRDDYYRVDDSNRERLRLEGEKRREQQARARAEGRSPLL